MKRIGLILALTLTLSYAQAQRKSQKIKIFKLKTGFYLEVSQKDKDELNDALSALTSEEKRELGITPPILKFEPLTIERNYWLSLQSSNLLKAGYQKVIKWADLNTIHKKEFEKEVCRFRLLDKETYRTHGNVGAFSSQAKLTFFGKEDGTFYCVLEIVEDAFEIGFESKRDVQNFINLLNGTYQKKPIDKIFN